MDSFLSNFHLGICACKLVCKEHFIIQWKLISNIKIQKKMYILGFEISNRHTWYIYILEMFIWPYILLGMKRNWSRALKNGIPYWTKNKSSYCLLRICWEPICLIEDRYQSNWAANTLHRMAKTAWPANRVNLYILWQVFMQYSVRVA